MTTGRHDRTGELVDEPDELDDQAHAERCREGWLGEDWQGHPIPCPRCRGHVVRLRLPGGTSVTTVALPDPRRRRAAKALRTAARQLASLAADDADLCARLLKRADELTDARAGAGGEA